MIVFKIVNIKTIFILKSFISFSSAFFSFQHDNMIFNQIFGDKIVSIGCSMVAPKSLRFQ